jgi:hypothetical protein
MKKINISLLSFCLILMSFQLSLAQFTQVRKISGFQKVKLQSSFDYILVQNEEESISIESERLPLEMIISELEADGTLKIYNKAAKRKFWDDWDESKYLDGGEYQRVGKVRIIVNYKTLKEIGHAGSGSLRVKSPIECNDFKLQNSGSGLVSLEKLSCNLAEIQNYGSGKIEINDGKCVNQNVKVSGSGDINLGEVISENVVCMIRGSGNIKLKVEKSLEGKVSGSGSITYVGNPAQVISKAYGSGSIRRVN